TLKSQLLLAQAKENAEGQRRPLVDEAVRTLEKARSVQPRNLEVLRGLAAAYLDQQNIGQVIQTYKDIVAVNPRDTYSLLMLANILSKTQHLQEALPYLEKVVEQRPGFMPGYIMLGQVREQMGQDA